MTAELYCFADRVCAVVTSCHQRNRLFPAHNPAKAGIMSVSHESLPASPTKLTYDDYVLFPDDGKRHEIIDGRHYMNPAPNPRHQAVSRHIQFQLYEQIELTKLGEVINSPIDLQLSLWDVVQPDIVVVLAANRIITTTKIKSRTTRISKPISKAIC